MRDFGRLLIIFGAVAILTGIVLSTGNRLGLGRLPGDIVYRRGDFSCYVPLATSILLSALLTLLLWIFRR